MPCTVALLAHTPHPDELVAAAARICYRDVTAADLLAGERESLSGALLDQLCLNKCCDCPCHRGLRESCTCYKFITGG